MPSKRDLGNIANHLVPNPGDEAWIVDPDQPEHYHTGQNSGETHADGYYLRNDGGRPVYEKYHSDDK